MPPRASASCRPGACGYLPVAAGGRVGGPGREALPALAQGGFGLAGQQRIERGLALRFAVAGALQALLAFTQRGLQAGDALRQVLRVLAFLLLARQRLGDGLRQVATRAELLAPGAQALAEQAVLRIGRQLRLYLPALIGQGIVPFGKGRRPLLAVATRLPQAVDHLALGLGLLFAHLGQGRGGLRDRLPGPLPIAVLRAQALGRLAGGQALQLRAGLLQRLPGILALLHGGELARLGAGQGFTPLALALQAVLLAEQCRFTIDELGEFVLQLLAPLLAQQLDALGRARSWPRAASASLVRW